MECILRVFLRLVSQLPTANSPALARANINTDDALREPVLTVWVLCPRFTPLPYVGQFTLRQTNLKYQ